MSVLKANKHSSLQMSSMATVRTGRHYDFYVVHSIALTKHKQLIAHEGPHISYLRRYSVVVEIELDLPGDRHVCYESANDNLKLNFSSTPSCAVPIKLRIRFADWFICRSVTNALTQTSHHGLSWKQPMSEFKQQKVPKQLHRVV